MLTFSFSYCEGVERHAGPNAVQEDQGSPNDYQILPTLQSQVLHPRGSQTLPGREDHEGPWEACEVANPSQSAPQVRGGPAGHFQ